MTDQQRAILECHAIGDDLLARALRAALAELDRLRREHAQDRETEALSDPEGALHRPPLDPRD